jgi:L-ascorbate metabolism protein UlaG (beta-lactamase superfamily)
MRYYYTVTRYSVLLLLLQTTTIWCLSKPIIKDGRYYYGPADTYEHIDMSRAIKFLGKRILSPAQWKNKVISFVNTYFYKTTSAADEKESPLMPQPTQTIPAKESIEPTITWIGHSSFLIQINGFNILTDPVFGNVKALSDPLWKQWRTDAITITKRLMKPGIKFKNLPPIDAILISHNHSDHTDTHSLMALQKKYNPEVFVPMGNGSLFASMGFTRIVETNWWDRYKLTKDGRTIAITCVPAYHWSIRFSLASYRKSLWSGWMISGNDTNIYFAGDTAYGPFFKEIAQQFPSITVALLPIGPSGPMDQENEHKYSHVDARQAVDAFIDLNAPLFIPMHYGTFFSSDHSKYPLPMLLKTWQDKQASLQGKKLFILPCGEQYKI